MKTPQLFTALLVIALVFSTSIFAQQSVKPIILKRVYSEKTRDQKLEAAIFSATEIGDSEDKETRYYYNRVDLNGDKNPEILVYVFGGGNCGTGGCNALLFHKVRGKYKLTVTFGPVRNPIIVSQHKTKGWNDLIFFNSGGGIIPGYFSVCRFNGKNYPDNPTVERDAPPLKTRLKGIAYVSGIGYGESGLRFQHIK
jgi:hypothetical protein